jgi:hypothetical protein
VRTIERKVETACDERMDRLCRARGKVAIGVSGADTHSEQVVGVGEGSCNWVGCYSMVVGWDRDQGLIKAFPHCAEGHRY